MEMKAENMAIPNINITIMTGENVKPIQLTDITGRSFDSTKLNGSRYMISFFRFASCPFCNLRIHELIRHNNEFASDFTIVAIFDSPLENLRKHSENHKAPFTILADQDNTYYRKYGIKHSWAGVLKGMVTRFPSLLKAMFVHGYWPLRFKGEINTMPADFLIDENGIIQRVYYGKDEGDHLSFDEIKQFSHRQTQ